MAKKRDKSGADAHASVNSLPEGAAFDVAVVGGGAAGLACVAACAQAAPGMRIALFEAGRRVGTSIMRSGNGRCNFSNSQLDVARYHNAEFAGMALAALDKAMPNDVGAPDALHRAAPSPVVAWFERLGLVWAEAPGSQGMLFPFSNHASTVLDVLRRALDEGRVSVFTESRVRHIAPGDPAGFAMEIEQPRESDGAGKGHGKDRARRTVDVAAGRVVIAAGGGFDEALLGWGSCGRHLVPRRPVLGPIRASAPAGVSLASLDGIRVAAQVSVPERSFQEAGEVLFRPYGISGIVAFDASRVVRMGDRLFLDVMPAVSLDALAALLTQRATRLAGRTAAGFMEGLFVPSLSRALLQAAGIEAHRPPSQADVLALAQVMKRFPLTVNGIGDERQCQVHRGGLDVGAVGHATLEVCDVPGLYVVGEALDVDGPCGGYNLHWAWASGILAGRAAAKR